MQKALRRTALAKGQAKRKAKLKDDHEFRIQLAESRQGKKEANRERTQAIQDERRRRREDWELASLSPYRNNFNRLTASEFGTWSLRQVQLRPKPERSRMKDLMIREGDRVVVVEGHENIKGRVGKVKEVMEEQEMLILEGINRVEVKMPEDLREEGDTQTVEMPISYGSVRLVYPLPDPVTGIPRDVVLNNLTARRRRFDIYENEQTFDRWLEPQHIRIPWPEKKVPNYADEEFDTLRVHSEHQSFLPTLLRPPMPLGVIDELRNKYSKFRDRHDDEFVARKRAEDQIAEIEKKRQEGVKPTGAFNVARRRGLLRRSKDQPILSDELAARIGEHMAVGGVGQSGIQTTPQAC